MKHVFRILLSLAFIVGTLGFLPAAAVSAEAWPSYVSGITVVNLTNSPAEFTIQYVRQGGSTADATVSAPYPVAENAVYDFAAIPVDNFKGSVIIASNQLVGAISTLQGGPSSTDLRARGSYVGASSGSKSVVLPFVARKYGSAKWTTFVSVQNAGDLDTEVTIHYTTGCATGNDTKQTIKPGSMVIFDQGASCLADGNSTSATLTSSVTDILAVVTQENPADSAKPAALVSTGFATAGSTAPVIPLINEANPASLAAGGGMWRTALLVYNNGNATTTLTLTYNLTDGSSCFEKMDIPAKASKTFLGNTFLPAGSRPTDTTYDTTCQKKKMVGSAFVAKASDNSAGVPLNILVNQDLGNNSAGAPAGAYDSFDPSVATPIVVMPLIMDNNGKGLWGTSFNVMNVGDTQPYVKCTFVNSSYAPNSLTAYPNGMAKYGMFEDLQRGKLALTTPKPITSGKCVAYTDKNFTTIDTNAKIVAAVNERGTAGAGDLMLTYEAINIAP